MYCNFSKKVGSTLRVLIVAVSLGMGVDCPDICKIINPLGSSRRLGTIRAGEGAEAIL